MSEQNTIVASNIAVNGMKIEGVITLVAPENTKNCWRAEAYVDGAAMSMSYHNDRDTALAKAEKMQLCYLNAVHGGVPCEVTGKDIHVSTGRTGTAIAEKAKLIELFGEPFKVHSSESDGKVTTVWNIQTPAGNVKLRDYYWNATDEWSLAAENDDANKQAIVFLINKGIKANEGTRKV